MKEQRKLIFDQQEIESMIENYVAGKVKLPAIRHIVSMVPIYEDGEFRLEITYEEPK